jgi:putative membrane protein
MDGGAVRVRRSWSPPKVAVGLGLATWAALFWFLLLSGRWALYLSSRVKWVVPAGAVVLTVVAIGRLATARTRDTESLTGRQAWGLGGVVLPAVAVLLFQPMTLGASLASSQSLGRGFVSSATDLSSGQITLASVAAAQWSDEGKRALQERAGSRVSFEGFVALRDGMPADEFMLSRFIISCCAADALSVQVRVVGALPGKFQQDQWLRVTGNIYPVGNEVVLDASKIVPIARPKNPYLNP